LLPDLCKSSISFSKICWMGCSIRWSSLNNLSISTFFCIAVDLDQSELISQLFHINRDDRFDRDNPRIRSHKITFVDEMKNATVRDFDGRFDSSQSVSSNPVRQFPLTRKQRIQSRITRVSLDFTQYWMLIIASATFLKNASVGVFFCTIECPFGEAKIGKIRPFVENWRICLHEWWWEMELNSSLDQLDSTCGDPCGRISALLDDMPWKKTTGLIIHQNVFDFTEERNIDSISHRSITLQDGWSFSNWDLDRVWINTEYRIHSLLGKNLNFLI
jgi:hypothetical protein